MQVFTWANDEEQLDHLNEARRVLTEVVIELLDNKDTRGNGRRVRHCVKLIAKSMALARAHDPNDTPAPHDDKLEREVLGNLFFSTDTDVLKQAFADLESEDFFQEQHKIMFMAVRDAHKQGIPHQSPSLIVTWLQEQGRMEKLCEAMKREPVDVREWVEVLEVEAVTWATPRYVIALKKIRARRQEFYAMVEAWADTRGEIDPGQWLKKMYARLAAVKSLMDKIHEIERRYNGESQTNGSSAKSSPGKATQPAR